MSDSSSERNLNHHHGIMPGLPLPKQYRTLGMTSTDNQADSTSSEEEIRFCKCQRQRRGKEPRQASSRQFRIMGRAGEDTAFPKNKLDPHSLCLRGYDKRHLLLSRSEELLCRRRFLQKSDRRMKRMMSVLGRGNTEQHIEVAPVRSAVEPAPAPAAAVSTPTEVEPAPAPAPAAAVSTPTEVGCCAQLPPGCSFFCWLLRQARKLWARALHRVRSEDDVGYSRPRSARTSDQQMAARTRRRAQSEGHQVATQLTRRTQSEGQIVIRTSTRPISNEHVLPRTTFNELETSVVNYLNEHPELLKQYVEKQVNLRTIEGWYKTKYEKQMHNIFDEPSTAMLKGESVAEYNRVMQTLSTQSPDQEIIFQMAPRLRKMLRGNAHRILKILKDVRYSLIFTTQKWGPRSDTGIYFAKIKPPKRIIQVLTNKSYMYFTEFNNPLEVSSRCHIFQDENNKEKLLKHVLCVPITGLTGSVEFVIEVWRSALFTMQDLEVACDFMSWACMTVYLIDTLKENMFHDERINFLLKTIKNIFEEIDSYEHVIERILKFAQKLVKADRASLFMVDYEKEELVSHVFDMKFDSDEGATHVKPIRMPISSGFAGYVATSGKSLNIPNAYADERFNSAVDQMTGYRTRGILCMPIKVGNKTIAVVQMINKRTRPIFDIQDECSFNLFSAFFGLALQHAGLYDRIVRKEQKYRVALEVLSYHNTCREAEVLDLLTLSTDEEIYLSYYMFEDFHVDPFKLSMMHKCHALTVMFHQLFLKAFFEAPVLARFILTVKKNYRDVPYHNFEHGWSVAQAMYALLQHDTYRRFSFIKRLALFVASLCHDLDHRGYTNKYMSETASPLAAMYTTSTLEHHHFNITVSILQQEDHNILSRLTSTEYKEVLSLIKHCILATDLAAFFPNLRHIQQLHADGTFDWNNKDHLQLAMAICMTAADLSASAKPFKIQEKTVRVIFEEFYDQGDKERAAGRVPIPMMDRSKPHEQPSSQVEFINQICLPCYDMVRNLLPKTEIMFQTANQNLKIWEKMAADMSITRQLESPDSEPNSLHELDELSEDSTTPDDELETVRLAMVDEPESSDSEKSEVLDVCGSDDCL